MSKLSSYKRLVAYTLIAVLSFVLTSAFMNYFTIRQVTVDGASYINGVQSLAGMYIHVESVESIKQSLQAQNPTLEVVSVHKHYPQTLYLIVKEKRPTAELILADGSMHIADDGMVLSKSKSHDLSDLPPIKFYQPLFYNQYKVGDKLDIEEITTATFMSGRLLDLGLLVSTIDIASENMIVLHTDAFELVVTSEKESEAQFLEFQYTYKQLKIAGKEIRSIDIRFEKPIIKLQ